jgi:hypothetical protein
MINKQDFLNAWTQEIEMVRGDTLAFNFQLAGLGSEAAYQALTCLFAVSEHYDENNVVEVGNYNGIFLVEYDAAHDVATFGVSIAPFYTSNLPLTRYYYELKIKDEDDNVVTLMRGHLTLLFNLKD